MIFNFERTFRSINITMRIQQLKTMLAESPKNCFLTHALALEYIKLNDDDTARQYFEANLANDSNYIATYYHLGQLLERKNLTDEAIAIYQKGMTIADQIGDKHSYSELRSVYEELTF